MKIPMLFGLALVCRAQNAAIPTELVGTWGYTETSVTQYQNRATGAFARPSGSSSSFQIFPDGSFKNWDLIQQSMYSCSTTIFITQTGHVAVEGERIVFRYEGGHVSSKDNCHARFNYEKNAAPEVKTHDAWTIRPSANGPQLLLASGGHLQFVYTKKLDR